MFSLYSKLLCATTSAGPPSSGCYDYLKSSLQIVSQTIVSEFWARVAHAITSLSHQYVAFPNSNMLHIVIEDFMQLLACLPL